jgi:hypothetical protein
LREELTNDEQLQQECKDWFKVNTSSGPISGMDEMNHIARQYALVCITRSHKDGINQLHDCVKRHYNRFTEGHNKLKDAIEKCDNHLNAQYKHDILTMEYTLQQGVEIEAIERAARIQRGETVTPGKPTSLQEARAEFRPVIARDQMLKHISRFSTARPQPSDKKVKAMGGTAIDLSKESSGVEESPTRKGQLTRIQASNNNTHMEVEETTDHSTNNNSNRTTSDSTNSDNNTQDNENDSNKNEQRPLGHADSSGETDCTNHV